MPLLCQIFHPCFPSRLAKTRFSHRFSPLCRSFGWYCRPSEIRRYSDIDDFHSYGPQPPMKSALTRELFSVHTSLTLISIPFQVYVLSTFIFVPDIICWAPLFSCRELYSDIRWWASRGEDLQPNSSMVLCTTTNGWHAWTICHFWGTLKAHFDLLVISHRKRGINYSLKLWIA